MWPMPRERIGKYRIIEEVGRGGMAVVYRAQDTVLGRTVALKLLHPHLSADSQALARLAAEAKAVARLHHPLIPEVYEYAEVSDGDDLLCYITTEFVEGHTLAWFLRNHEFSVPESSLLVVHRVLEALAHAHESGIIHRDLKPENIMITPDGEPRLMDFGIARVLENPSLTATGQILGSPAYMSPEILMSKTVTFASDVFSMGIILYRMLTGRLPFEGTSPHAVLVKIAECDYPDPEALRPEIGGLIASFVRRVLSLEPEDRPQDAGEMLKEVDQLLKYAGISSGDVPELSRRVLTRPEEFEQELGAMVVEGLRNSLDDMSKGARFQTLSRLLLVAPDDEEVQQRWMEYHASRRSGSHWLPASLVAVGLFMAGTAFVFGAMGEEEVYVVPFTLPDLPKPDTADEDLFTSDSSVSNPDSSAYMHMQISEHGQRSARPSEDVSPSDARQGTTAGPRPHAAKIHPFNVRKARRVLARKFKKHLPLKRASSAVRKFSIMPFPQGKVKIYLDNRYLGQWGPGGDGISEVSVPAGRHTITLRHPLCYERSVEITPSMKGRPLRIRLPWRSARLVVKSPPEAVVAVRTLEGEKRVLAGLPNAPIEIPFPRVWDRSVLRVKVMISLPGGRSVEKIVSVRAGSFNSIDIR